MPFINISTSVKVQDKKKLLQEITTLVSSLTKKSKKFVMAKLEDDSQMYFDDDKENCCYLEIKSIGSLDPSKIAKPICDFIHEKIGVPLDKIYIYFEDVPASMWGWNGKTFG